MRYAIIGHVALVYIPSPDRRPSEEELERILRNPKVKTVLGRIGSFGLKRRVKSVILAGEPKTITIHKELSTYFVLDVARITFSPGNHFERKRLIEIVEDGERILDMFAAVGNLSMPVAKHRKVEVIGIEICGYTYGFLLRTIRKNRLKNYLAVLGDSRLSSPTRRADRVFMGFFELDERHVLAAARALRSKGRLHMHMLAEKRREEEEIEKFLERRQRIIDVIEYSRRVVKSYSPRLNHVVIDVYARSKIR